MQATRIKSFKPLGIKKTIDLEVDSTDHNFYLKNLITSNSHSISYANLAAITIYLKFNHPQQFYLSLLKYAQFEPNPHEEISKITQELPLFGIKLLAPDLAQSEIDFTIQGNDIRYGLNSIKGVSTKSLESLIEFREGEFKNKYEVFLAAKQAGLNIGVVSALIQAGVLDHFVTKDRCRLVLEAQAFNLLTDREKRSLIVLGDKFNYDILKCIHECTMNASVDDNNKLIFSEKRFTTFKSKYEPYKVIYEKNHKHLKFANWYFETKLLGYSHSTNIREVFTENSGETLISSSGISELGNNEKIKFVGTVSDVISRTSARGNKYARLEMSDESGNLTALMMDSQQNATYSNFLQSGKILPKKGEVIILTGRKSNDIISINSLSPLEDKIYMKLSDVK